jgi:hypothetical protein
MPSSEIVAFTKGYIDHCLKNDGCVHGVIFLHRTDGEVAHIPYKSDKSIPLAVEQAAICEVIRSMKSQGLFAGAVLVAEAWMVKAPVSSPLVGLIPPSLDPDRIEIVTALVVAFDGGKHTAMWPMIREGGKVRCGAEIDGGEKYDKIESWLDDAFK